MIGEDIQFLLNDYKDFGGVYTAPYRSRCRKGKLYILNSAGYPGVHWLALDLRGEDPEFFDSFGHSVDYYGFNDVAFPYVKHSTVQLQQNNSDVCGAYCVMYAVYKLEGNTLRDMLERFNTRQLRYNDAVVLNWLQNFEGVCM